MHKKVIGSVIVVVHKDLDMKVPERFVIIASVEFS